MRLISLLVIVDFSCGMVASRAWYSGESRHIVGQSSELSFVDVMVERMSSGGGGALCCFQ